jgi:SAM-dependent methyltransferase
MARDWVSCPVCESRSFATLAHTDRYRMGVQTCQCRGCGLAMTNPVPSDEALSSFYRNDYRLYYRKVARPSEEHIKEYALTERAAYTAGFLRDAGLLEPARAVLDVGCADGSLLRAIGGQAPGAALVGVEPNPHFGEFARSWAGATVYADVADVERAGRKFDLITVNHVLEHVREPIVFLRRLAALCTPGGSIYLDVPDAARYRSIDDLHLAHLYHFTSASLANTARRADLLPQRVEKHEPTRHPLSVRAVLSLGGQGGGIDRDPEAEVVGRRIRWIGRLAPAFAFRRTAFGRVLLNGPLRLWHTLSRAA